MKSVSLNVTERLILAHKILPAKGGSFSEALRVRNLRNRLTLTPGEQKAIGFEESDRGFRWDVSAAAELPDLVLELDEKDLRIIALGFRLFEQDGAVPTDDGFLNLYEKFAADVESVEV